VNFEMAHAAHVHGHSRPRRDATHHHFAIGWVFFGDVSERKHHLRWTDQQLQTIVIGASALIGEIPAALADDPMSPLTQAALQFGQTYA